VNPAVAVTRAFGYALLAAFIGLVYGTVLGATGWILRVEGWSAIVAMAVVAMVIEPVRVRLQALANRLVFGQSLSPRDAMRALVTRLQNVAASDELTSVVVAGTRCSAAQLWLVSGDELRLVAAAPPDGVGRRPLAATGMTVTGADMCVQPWRDRAGRAGPVHRQRLDHQRRVHR
jgi:hypothetical protein